MKIVFTLVFLLLLSWVFFRYFRRYSQPVCPRGYYYTPGPNSFGGNPRQCIPIGESSSEDAIPSVNYMPELDWSVLQTL
jgi:hypothetical protein